MESTSSRSIEQRENFNPGSESYDYSIRAVLVLLERLACWKTLWEGGHGITSWLTLQRREVTNAHVPGMRNDHLLCLTCIIPPGNRLSPLAVEAESCNRATSRENISMRPITWVASISWHSARLHRYVASNWLHVGDDWTTEWKRTVISEV